MDKCHLLYIPLVILSLFIFSCSYSDEGLTGIRETPPGKGVRISWDPFAKPVALIPFPNNIVTRFDEYSPTGLRLNVPYNAYTDFENLIRGHINDLDGFGTFAPITVPFEDTIDISTVLSSLPEGKDDDYRPSPDDTVFLINLNNGRFIPLDLGRGHFPIDLHKKKSFWPNDPLRDAPNYLFDPYYRERFYRELGIDYENCDDPSTEDIDILSDFRKCPRVEFYEYASDTLFLRPIWPLDEKSLHAVILTDGIEDINGNPIRSPFRFINHTFQTRDLRRAMGFLHKIGVSEKDVSFAWTFTTQSIYRFLDNVRDGMDGKGKMSYLKGRFPPRAKEIIDLEIEEPTDKVNLLEGGNPEYNKPRDDSPYLLDARFMSCFLNYLFFEDGLNLIDEVGEDIDKDAFKKIFGFENVDYFVFGSFLSPSFLVSPSETAEVDFTSGLSHVGVLHDPYDLDPGVPFFAAIPRPTTQNNHAQPPYPVVLFQHGHTATGFTAIALANYMAGLGIATAGIDAPCHGPLFDIFPYLIGSGPTTRETLMAELGLEDGGDWLSQLLEIVLKETILPFFEIPSPDDPLSLNDIGKILKDIGFFRALFYYGRAVDVNDDGVRDPAENFFTANIFKTRDIIAQTVVDMMQFTRVLRNFGDQDGDGVISMEEGNFNEDDALDIGGPDNSVFYAGQSLGGIAGGIFMGAENIVDRGAPNVGGGGLTDILLRTTLSSVAEKVYMEIFGPVVVGRPCTDCQRSGMVKITLNDDKKVLDTITLKDGQTVILENKNTGEEKEVVVGPNPDKPRYDFPEGGNFALSIGADPGDIVVLYRKDDPGAKVKIEIDEYHQGLGIERNSPRFTNMISMAQMALDSMDPINYAPRYRNKKVLIQVAMGDTTVPVSTGLALARAAGFLNQETHNESIRSGILFGHTYQEAYKIIKRYEDESFLRLTNDQYDGGLRLYFGPHEFFLIPSFDWGDYFPGEDEYIDYTQKAQRQAGLLYRDGIIEDNPDEIFIK